MKTKKLSKKLNINKKTIANLSDSELNSARGGTTGLTVCLTCTIPCLTIGCGGGGGSLACDREPH